MGLVLRILLLVCSTDIAFVVTTKDAVMGEGSAALPVRTPARAVAGNAPVEVDAKEKKKAVIPPPGAPVHEDVKPRLIPAMSKIAIAGMIAIRPSILKCVDSERMRLRAESHDAGRELERAMTRFNQEQDHLKFLTRKVAEKADTLDRAIEEHRAAHDAMLAARSEEADVATAGKDHARGKKPIANRYDTLVRSWADNVENSHRSLNRWEFKMRRQTTLVNRAADDVEAAEVTKAAHVAEIEAGVFQMSALAQFVKDL